MIDAHIHLDKYTAHEQATLLASGASFITVAMDYLSCLANLQLAQHPNVHSALGYHPEQAVASAQEEAAIFDLIRANQHTIVAIGEVGLPYYKQQDRDAHMELLERFIKLAKELDKPIVLHAVYEDAPIVCDLLEKHAVTAAHFHWFKGDEATIARMIENGYFVSVTPDVCYEQEIRSLVQRYPLTQLMIETDGPWPFEHEFSGQVTTPAMMARSIEEIAKLKQLPVQTVAQQLYTNTKKFYRL